MSKRLKLRRSDRCASCDVALAVGTTAYWFPSERHTKCVPCVETDRGAQALPAQTNDVATSASEAGRSARAVYERRSDRERHRQEQAVANDAAWRQQVKSTHRVLGPVVTAFTPKPVVAETRSTTAWKVGAEGEARVGEVLRDVAGIEVLHDRRWPGTRSANIDHIVVAPSGVFVIDAKKYQGKLEIVDKGSWLRSDWRLYVNGRNQTKLVEGVAAQAEAVRGALDGVGAAPVSGVLCFIGADWGIFGPRKVKTLKDVTILWPLKLPEFVTGPGTVDVAATAAHLRAALRPATSSER